MRYSRTCKVISAIISHWASSFHLTSLSFGWALFPNVFSEQFLASFPGSTRTGCGLSQHQNLWKHMGFEISDYCWSWISRAAILKQLTYQWACFQHIYQMKMCGHTHDFGYQVSQGSTPTWRRCEDKGNNLGKRQSQSIRFLKNLDDVKEIKNAWWLGYKIEVSMFVVICMVSWLGLWSTRQEIIKESLVKHRMQNKILPKYCVSITSNRTFGECSRCQP